MVQSSPCSIAYSLTAQLTYKTTTWDGTAWDNGAPDLTTRAIFSSTYTSDGAGSGDLNACSLHVLSGAVVTVTSGDSFTVMNEIHVDSTTLPATLIVEDSSNLIQVNPVVNTAEIACLLRNLIILIGLLQFPVRCCLLFHPIPLLSICGIQRFIIGPLYHQLLR